MLSDFLGAIQQILQNVNSKQQFVIKNAGILRPRRGTFNIDSNKVFNLCKRI